MSEEDKVIHVSDRLRDGREVKTDKDHQQWVYEYFARLWVGHDPDPGFPPNDHGHG